MSDEADPEDVELAVEAVEAGFEWLESPHANQIQLECDHVLLENDERPDELAIFPSGSAPGAWVVASGRDSFESLETMR